MTSNELMVLVYCSLIFPLKSPTIPLCLSNNWLGYGEYHFSHLVFPCLWSSRIETAELDEIQFLSRGEGFRNQSAVSYNCERTMNLSVDCIILVSILVLQNNLSPVQPGYFMGSWYSEYAILHLKHEGGSRSTYLNFILHQAFTPEQEATSQPEPPYKKGMNNCARKHVVNYLSLLEIKWKIALTLSMSINLWYITNAMCEKVG